MNVLVNDNGNRIGKSHHWTKISDDVVCLIRDMHEIRRKSYMQISRKLGISYYTIKKICRYERRIQNTVKMKWVSEENGNGKR